MKSLTKQIVAVAGLAFAGTALAVSHLNPMSGYTDGEVRKVDKANGKVTLKHGPIANLDMAPMTMVFVVKDPAMLARVKTGDKVKFKAEKIQGAYTVTELAPSRP
jgi:Cu(I)/Ag(I) efflux system periplasmic protein CusF